MMLQGTESRLRKAYWIFYDALCGTHPNLRPWHFQWLAARPLNKRLRALLPTLAGEGERRVLDIGCGTKPYAAWFRPIAEYVRLDIMDGPMVDVVVKPNEKWPLSDAYYDVIICTQVLEHVEDLEHTLREMKRVLKPGGIIVASFPFIYNEHGIPHDYRRFSAYGAERLFLDMNLITVERQGGIGSTAAILLLNFWDATLSLNFYFRLMKAVLLPVNLLAATMLNIAALLLDRLDRTGRYYSNVLIVVKKPKTTSMEDILRGVL